jgi:hypothetical protein
MVSAWEEQYRAALDEWQRALDAFNAADGDFVDYSVLRLYAAEQRLAVVLRQLRQAHWNTHKGTPAGRPPHAVPPGFPAVQSESSQSR